MILSLHRQLDATQRRLRGGIWQVQTPQPIRRLSKLTLGLVGLGRIGRRMAALLGPCVERTLFHDPNVSDSPPGIVPAGLQEVLQQADIVSLHCPLLPETRRLINRQTLGIMKSTALLINVARGGLLDTVALVEALKEHRLAGAGLDVYEPEVLPLDSPLRNLDNVILTSHTAWYSQEAILDCRTQAAQKIVNALAE
jgi:D-3-phosphoglycerate dehydrogenase